MAGSHPSLKYSWILLSILVFPFLASAQIFNHSFEEWDVNTEGIEEPKNWPTNNTLLNGQNFISVYRDTIAYQGNYSARLTANYPTVEGLCPGQANLILRESDFVAFPSSLQAWVKCDIPDPENKGVCKIYITYYKDGELIEGPKWSSRETIEDFQLIEIPMTPQSFDSLSIHLQGGSVVTPTGCQGQATMWVDFIDFVYLTSSTTEPDAKHISVYPNPMIEQKELFVQSNNTIGFTKYRIYDLLGKHIAHQRLHHSTRFSIQIASLPKGTYVLELTDTNNQQFFKKIVKQ